MRFIFRNSGFICGYTGYIGIRENIMDFAIWGFRDISRRKWRVRQKRRWNIKWNLAASPDCVCIWVIVKNPKSPIPLHWGIYPESFQGA